MKKVIIVGAGPAGLTAGYQLIKEKEYEIVILEESNDIGGISKTIKYKGNRMDIGGHRFFSKNQEILDLWKELMPIQAKDSYDDKKLGIHKELPKDGPDPEKEDKVMLIRNRVSRIYYLKKFFDYPISLKIETFKNLGLKRTLKAGFSYLKSIFVKKKNTSLENFYINRFGKQLYQMFFEKYTEKLWGRHPKDISADWGSQRVKGLSILEIIKDVFNKKFNKKNVNKQTSLIEEFWYPKYGPGQLWETLAEEIEKNGGKILKNHKVKQIYVEKEQVKYVVVEHDNKEYKIEGDILISSMPIKDLVINMIGEEVPNKILDIAKGLPYRDFLTVGVLVKKLNLKNLTQRKTLSNIVPDCWIYVQEPDVKMGRIQIFNNWSPYMVEKPEETVWLGLEYFVDENDKYWNMSEAEFCNFATDELVKMGIIEKQDILETHQEKVKKAYPAYFDTYSQIDELIDYLNKISNLYCIGRNGQHRYNNMDHSMLTAIEATNNINAGIKTKDNIWKVNTEEEYNEIKKE